MAPVGEGCALFIARGSAGVEDIDLFAFGDDGALLGADEAPNATPSVLVCPPHPLRAFVSARVAAGFGLVALGVQAVPKSAAARVSAALGARKQTDPAGGEWGNLDARLEEHRKALGGRWQLVRRTAIPVEQRLPTHLTTRVEAGGCADVLVLPGDGVSHLELALLDDEGRNVGRPQTQGGDRTALVCSEREQELTLEVRAQAGRGMAAVLVSSLVPESRGELDPRLPILELVTSLPLQEARKRHAESAGLRALSRPHLERTGELGTLKRTSLPLELLPGCSRIDVVLGTPALGALGWLWSAEGTLLAQGSGSAAFTLETCGPARKVRLDLEGAARGGPFALEVRSDAAAGSAWQKSPLAASRLLARVRAAQLSSAPSTLGTPETVALSDVELTRRELRVPVGQCLDVTLGLEAHAAGAELRILEQRTGDELVLARGAESAHARTCALDAPAPVDVSVELRARAGAGTGLLLARLLTPPR
jgi:hypothetical protein